MSNKRKSKIKNKRSREMRKFVEAGGQKCLDFFRHLASSQQWRDHGTLPPLSNDEALILNHMYQIWLQQSPEQKESFLRAEEGEGTEPDHHFPDPLQQLLPAHSSSGGGSIVLPPRPSAPGQVGEQSSQPQSVSVSLCMSTIKANLALHKQHSDSLSHLVNQLDVLIKAPEPTRTHANDLVVMLLSPDFIHRDLAALEQRVDMVNKMQQQRQNSPEEWERERQVHLSVASACCILLALLAESEHRITQRYQASLPAPYQRLLAKAGSPHRQEDDSSSTGCAEDLKRLYDDIATSYYLRSLTIAFAAPTEHSSAGDGSSSSPLSDLAAASTNGCGGRNSIAAMQLGSKYLRGGVEQGALLSSPSRLEGGTDSVSDKSEHTAAVLSCEQEYRQAFQWFLQAALLENPIAQHKVGYFYDEGLPGGACDVHIVEAVKWYSRAAEVMPDSMHNLAKIYEDGRGGFEADLPQAVTLYSVAAARGFPLSQVNLGRLFLLGEEGGEGGGVRRDREAGKRLLTLAAESGDADAQMVVGMIHATPAFECYDLALSEHWLRCSLAGGKQDADRLLGRVRQQLQQQQQQQQDPDLSGTMNAPGDSPDMQGGRRYHHSSSLPPVPNRSPRQLAAAAKQRGEDFRRHRLLHAAVLEFSRAFELDRSCLGHFVDRLETLFLLGHFEECLSDSSLLLDCVDVKGEKLVGGSQQAARKEDPEISQQAARKEDPEIEQGPESDNAAAMKRLYMVLSRCLSCMHSDRERDSRAPQPPSPMPPVAGGRAREQGVAENFIGALAICHRDALIRWLLIDCMELSGSGAAGQDQSCPGGEREGSQGLGAARASALLARLSSLDAAGNKSIVRNGGVPVLLSVLETVCQSIWLSSSASASASSHTTVQSSHLVPCAESPKYAFVREQLWLNCLVIFQHLLNPPSSPLVSETATSQPPTPGVHSSAQQLEGDENDITVHYDDMKKKKMFKRWSVVQLISATDGFSTLTNCAVACLQAIIQTASFRARAQAGDRGREGAPDSPESIRRRVHTNGGDGDGHDRRENNNDDCKNIDSDQDISGGGDEGQGQGQGQGQERVSGRRTASNDQQQLHYYYFRDCIALTRTTTTVMQILHCTSTVAAYEEVTTAGTSTAASACLWPELLRGGLVRAFSCCIASSVLTAQLQLEALSRGVGDEEHESAGNDGFGFGNITSSPSGDEEEAPAPLPVLVEESSLNAPSPVRVTSFFSNAGISLSHADNASNTGKAQKLNSNNDSDSTLPFHLQVGHLCIALRHLSLTLQAAHQVLQRAPLEVLLRLSASDTMAALHQILRVLAPAPLPQSTALQDKKEEVWTKPACSESEMIPEAANSDSLERETQLLADSVRKNFLAAKELPPSPTPHSPLLSLSMPPAELLLRLPPAPSAHMLSALLLPLSHPHPLPAPVNHTSPSDDDVNTEVRVLSQHIARISPSYNAALYGSRHHLSSAPLGHSRLGSERVIAPCHNDGQQQAPSKTASTGPCSGREDTGEDKEEEEEGVVLPSLHSLGTAAGELKGAAAACLCALLCARDPHNSELLRVNFESPRLDHFLRLVYDSVDNQSP